MELQCRQRGRQRGAAQLAAQLLIAGLCTPVTPWSPRGLLQGKPHSEALYRQLLLVKLSRLAVQKVLQLSSAGPGDRLRARQGRPG